MKPIKYFILPFIALCATAFVSSCSDDPKDGDAPRLFRPVASLETSNNNIIASWDNIKGATTYTLTLYQVTGTDDNGDNIYTPIRTVTCNESPYRFDNLTWDEKYKVDISCVGETKSSLTYTTSDVSLSYPTTLKAVKTIENAARVSWEVDKEEQKIYAIKVVDAAGNEIVNTISPSQYLTGYIDIMGLEPTTKYTFYAYSDSEVYDNSTYAGKLTGTTTKVIDFDTEYGAGKWIDIRDFDEKMAKDTLKTSDFWSLVGDGYTVILRGDFDYKVNNEVILDRSVRFVTASTLGSNARFVSSGGMSISQDIDWVEFIDVDFISDKALPDGGNEIEKNTDKGFGGRQVINLNGVASSIKKLSFKGCTIQGYRAFLRTQQDYDGFNEVLIENCVINGIGDQGVFTSTNKLGDWHKITMRNTTVTNIVMLCDFRQTAHMDDASIPALTMNIENCTFCYAPMETTANANTPLFRLGDNEVTLNVSKTLFGPSMFTGGSGSSVTTYKAGEAGSIFVNGTAFGANVSKSFKTNFKWTEVGANLTTYPLDGLNELSMDETELWSKPSKGEFRIMGNIGEDGVGDARWNN